VCHVAGFWFYFFAPSGQRYRLLGWMYVVRACFFSCCRARSYYLAPAYPMLLAAGSVVLELWLATLGASLERLGQIVTAVILALAAIVGGWPEMVAIVAGIYAALSPDTRLRRQPP
jgi:hypothetical protein